MPIQLYTGKRRTAFFPKHGELSNKSLKTVSLRGGSAQHLLKQMNKGRVGQGVLGQPLHHPGVSLLSDDKQEQFIITV
jgi:hypothetical protein